MMQTPILRRVALAGLMSVTVTACGGGGGGSTPTPPPVVDVPPVQEPIPVPFQELYDQGVNRYLGEFTPMLSEAGAGGIIQHTFGAGDGPLCLQGGEYTMSTREGSGNALMIFMEGGGACTSQLCSATPAAAPGMPRAGILDPTDASNPAADYDVAYLPYCDGSIFSGDAQYDDDNDGTIDRYHRGVQNLSAALDVALNTFPSPSQILVTGNSAGGYGTDYALPLVRALYPDTPIKVINDSGVGIAFPGYVDFVSNEWNATAWIPESCTTCIGEDGHATDYHKYQLDEDANLTMGFMSTKQDSVIANFFLGIGGEAFEAALIAELAEIEQAHPDRFRSLVADGDGHTFLQRAFQLEVGGTTVRQWVADMLGESADWQSVSD